MIGQEFQAGTMRILYDPARVNAVSLEWADPDFWYLRGAVTGELGGRGQALQIETAAGPAVLRRYLRGGQVARISRDRYLFTGYRRSRGFCEWQVLAALNRRGLPVPAPILASCERSGIFYRAGLITTLIPGSRSLADVADQLGVDEWRQLGATLHRFFQAGLVHPDLNARNILIDPDNRWHLIDFDRARATGAPVEGRPMLQRLARSCHKLGIDLPREMGGD